MNNISHYCRAIIALPFFCVSSLGAKKFALLNTTIRKHLP